MREAFGAPGRADPRAEAAYLVGRSPIDIMP